MVSLRSLLCRLLLLATAISIAQGAPGKGLRLDLYHVHSSSSALSNGTSASVSDILDRDEDRVNSLIDRLTASHASNRSRMVHNILGPESVNVPVNPGLSIGVGNYYIKIGLGTPVKYYSMILDTGSSLSWMQCQPCLIYCHPQVDPVYDPKASKTYKPLSCSSTQCSQLKEATLNNPGCTEMSKTCVYTASYGDASYSLGFLSQDSVTLSPPETAPGFVFGCGLDNEGLFGQAAGLLGLARQPLSLLGQLSRRYGSAFSYCLPSANSGGKGFLSFGQGSARAAPFKFTPMITDSQERSLYFLRLAVINVGGKPIALAPEQYRVRTIIDSGTVITRLPMSIYSALKAAFVNAMSKKYAAAPKFSILDACFKGSLKSVVMPPIELVFQGGAGLRLTPENALIDVDNGSMCLAFAGSSGSGGIAVIGNRQQQKFDVVYDVSNSRIGFAPGSCR